MITHLNHYVPKWYQKRFLPNGSNAFIYLDLEPERIVTPHGKHVKIKEKCEWGPSKCFRQKDLYTTVVFGEPNDEIERYLFGAIDGRGAKAISALVNEDWPQLSKYFSAVFEYMDAQMLRTPKGLDWLKSRFGAQTQIQLMLTMQSIRQMHCTMWVEGVMEIVFADQSDTKFILTDHPVTVYNKECFPLSKYCRYPNEPLTAYIGTQTIFPLDFNRCFILTNLEYARNPKAKNDMLKLRTNPRFFATTMTRWDAVIRERHLPDKEVIKINYILKKRACKYIAAVKEEWLHPEKTLRNPMWDKLGSVLLPPDSGLWKFGGEIYVGGKDGKLMWYQDEFGRTIKDHAEAKYRQEQARTMESQFKQILKKHKEKNV